MHSIYHSPKLVTPTFTWMSSIASLNGGVGSEGMTVCEKDGQTDSPQLLEHLDPLTALGRLSLEHVAVVGFGGRGELRQVCGRQRQHRL